MSVSANDVYALYEKAYRLGAMGKGTRILGEALENAVSQGVSLTDLTSIMDQNATEENISKIERLADKYGWAFKVLNNDLLLKTAGWALSFNFVHRKGVDFLTKAMVNAVRGEA